MLRTVETRRVAVTSELPGTVQRSMSGLCPSKEVARLFTIDIHGMWFKFDDVMVICRRVYLQ